MELRPWTLEDDAAFFAERGYEASLGTDLSDRFAVDDEPLDREMYPHIAANQLRLLRMAAKITAPTLWIQALGVMADNDWRQATAFYDLRIAMIVINRSVAEALEFALGPELESPAPPGLVQRALLPHELRDLKHSLGAMLHELTHAGGDQDRGRFLNERLATHDDPRARAFLEGATEAKAARDLNLFISGLAIDATIPELLTTPYSGFYPLESSYVAELFAALETRYGRPRGNLLDNFVAHGCSLRALTDLLSESLPSRVRDDPGVLEAAVEIVLSGLDRASKLGIRSRDVGNFDEVEIQIGCATAAASALALSSLAVQAAPPQRTSDLGLAG